MTPVPDHLRIEDAVLEDVEALLQVQWAAFRGEAELYSDYTIPPLPCFREKMTNFGLTPLFKSPRFGAYYYLPIERFGTHL